KRKDKKIIIETEHQYVPTDRRKLVYQAASLMMETYGIQTDVNITIDKRNLIAAGLAGGSAHAAAAFRGIIALHYLGIETSELAPLSSQLGSDIPFCVYGGTAIASGRGEKIEHLPKPPNAWVILAKPKTNVSTKTIYQALKPGKNPPGSREMAAAVKEGDYKKIIPLMKND